jgi:hypothetical protein
VQCGIHPIRVFSLVVSACCTKTANDANCGRMLSSSLTEEHCSPFPLCPLRPISSPDGAVCVCRCVYPCVSVRACVCVCVSMRACACVCVSVRASVCVVYFLKIISKGRRLKGERTSRREEESERRSLESGSV